MVFWDVIEISRNKGRVFNKGERKGHDSTRKVIRGGHVVVMYEARMAVELVMGVRDGRRRVWSI